MKRPATSLTPFRAGWIPEHVSALGGDRHVEVEAGAALVGERPPHERRQQPLAHGELLDRVPAA